MTNSGNQHRRKLALAAFLSAPCSSAFVTTVSTCTGRGGPWNLRATTREDLPDYGTTSVDIDQIVVENKWRRRDLFGTTLLDQTMLDLETDEDFQLTAQKYKTMGAASMSKEERTQRRRALDSLGVPEFNTFLAQQLQTDGLLQRQLPQVLQINIGLYCNQACGHCHVESSPLRKEMMTAETAAQCLLLLKNTPSITTLDITGGAPELNDNFRYLVTMARKLRPDLDIIDRCNLTVLQEPGQEDLVDFLKQERVHIIASLPCYSANNVDQQRGSGVFDRSIAALLALNDAGYGTTLPLDLVYNPLGAFLPPPQASLEAKYHQVLQDDFGILFNSLFTMTNMPVKRFADYLHRRDELKDYLDLLVRNFNKDTTTSLMCLNTVSVGYDGKMFDCDFNQQLGYGIGEKEKVHDGGVSVFDIQSLVDLEKYAIRNDNHCFGCTAGMGSS
jgi:radical SAM/Cys-rich protein